MGDQAGKQVRRTAVGGSGINYGCHSQQFVPALRKPRAEGSRLITFK